MEIEGRQLEKWRKIQKIKQISMSLTHYIPLSSFENSTYGSNYILLYLHGNTKYPKYIVYLWASVQYWRDKQQSGASISIFYSCLVKSKANNIFGSFSLIENDMLTHYIPLSSFEDWPYGYNYILYQLYLHGNWTHFVDFYEITWNIMG